jgi:putative methionine-R-sulfoxide reductase with GAF domain
MDRDSIVSQDRLGELAFMPAEAPASSALPSVLITFKESGSLKDMAEHDLQASLQLLADRMCSLTGASAAGIAVKNANKLVCLARAGRMASELGASLRTDPIVVNRSINNQQIICCNNTRNAARNDGASYRELGVQALMIVPVVRESGTIAVLEVLSDKIDAFNDEHGELLEHVSAAVATALEHANAARRVPYEITGAEELELPSSADPDGNPAESDAIQNIRHCEVCGFPVSEGRKLCLDCEEFKPQLHDNGAAPGFLSDLAHEQKRGWLQSHFYTIGTLLMVLLTVVIVLLKLR